VFSENQEELWGWICPNMMKLCFSVLIKTLLECILLGLSWIFFCFEKYSRLGKTVMDVVLIIIANDELNILWNKLNFSIL
jgi:hypothetical protein